MSNKSKNSFYLQGSILAAASIVSRLIGLFFRIPLTNIIGNAGNGAYSSAYEVYNTALLLSTYSVPTAVSRIVSSMESKKEYKNSYKLFRVAMSFSIVVGFFMAALVFVFAEPLCILISKSEAGVLPLKILSPTIFVFALMGALRGFYQGKNTVIPTGLSQILEQVTHVVFALIFAGYFMSLYEQLENAYIFGATGAALGVLIGGIFALLFLIFVYVIYRPTLIRKVLSDKSQQTESYESLLGLLLITVVPIVINQTLYSITGLLDSTVYHNIMDRRGVVENTRLVEYGVYSIKFRVITNVPIAIASAIGVAIIPNVVKAFNEGRKRIIHEKVFQAVKFNMMIAIPSAFGLIALSDPIMSVLFNDTETQELATRLLVIGGLSVVFYGYATTTNSILHGIGKYWYPILHALIGIVVYLGVSIPLLLFTDLGIYSLAIGYMVFPFVVGILNRVKIHRLLSYYQENVRTFLLPSVFSLIMACIAYFVDVMLRIILGNGRFAETIALALAIMVGAVIYVLLMVSTQTLSENELYELPLGRTMLTIFKKVGFYKNND